MSQPSQSKNGELNWVWQLLFYLPVFLLGFIVIPIGVPLLGLAVGLISNDHPVSPWQDVAFEAGVLLIQVLVMISATSWALRKWQKMQLRNSGFAFFSGWGRRLGLGLVLGSLVIGLSVSLSWICSYYNFLGFAWQFRSLALVFPAFMGALIENVGFGLLEEIAFRGYIFQVFNRRWGTWIAVVASSLLFALVHLANLGNVYPAWMIIVSLTLLGVTLALAYLVSGSLWLPIGMHYTIDLMPTLLGEFSQAPNDAKLLASRVTGSQLITGPNGAGEGLFDMFGLALLAGIFLLLLIRKRRQVQSVTAAR